MRLGASPASTASSYPALSYSQAIAFSSFNNNAPAGLTDPYLSPPKPPVYLPLPTQTGHFKNYSGTVTDFPYAIKQPHWTTNLKWWTGQTILNVGAPQYANDPGEYLRSALVDSDTDALVNFFAWYYKALARDGANLLTNYEVYSLPAQAISKFKLQDYKRVLTDNGWIYLPFSYADNRAIYNAFQRFMYKYDKGTIGQMFAQLVTQSVPNPAAFPQVARLNPTTATTSPYGAYWLPAMYRKGEGFLQAYLPVIEIVLAVIAIVTAGMALAAFVAAESAGAAAGAAVTTAAGEAAGTAAVEATGGELTEVTIDATALSSADDVVAASALTATTDASASAIEEIVVNGTIPLASTMMTTGTLATVATLSATGAAALTTVPQSQPTAQQQQAQPQQNQSQQSTAQQLYNAAKNVKTIVSAGASIASALKSNGHPVMTAGSPYGGASTVPGGAQQLTPAAEAASLAPILLVGALVLLLVVARK